MKATDITWGGEAKCEFIVEGKMPVILIGVVINLEYDYVSQRYSMIVNGDRYIIAPLNTANKAVLDEYIRDGSWRGNLVRIIDVQESNVIVQMHIFFSIIDFNQLQKLTIQITDNVVDRLPQYAKENPIKFINNEFVYNQNIIFAYNFESKAKLQIISKIWRLDVDRKGNEFIATNMRRDSDIKNSVYMLRGNIEFVESTQNASVSKEVADKLQAISNTKSYFGIWEAYNDLEKLLLFKQAIEDGVAEYTSYEIDVKDAFIYKFIIKENALENCAANDIYIDCTDDEEILKIEKWEDLHEIKDFKPYSIGKISKIKNNVMYIIDENSETKKKLPKSGFLFKSLNGDSARIQRRNQAKLEIAKGAAPIPNLALLIDSGISTLRKFRNEQAITNRLRDTMKKNLGKNVDFNLVQKKAIEVAINTPDIALIQGPPGTGKTTVIKAIIARFEEYFQKNNQGEIPTILVTSFQHEAVDNAISNMNPSGLPANRLGGRRGEESKQQATVSTWIAKEQARCDSLIGEFETPFIYEKINLIKDEYFSWYSKGKDLMDGINILNRILQAHRLNLSYELINMINSIVSKINLNNENLIGMKRIVDIDTEAIAHIVSKQRITETSFEDDGISNALELQYAIECGLGKNEDVPECLLRVISTQGTDEIMFNMFVDYIKGLQEKYLGATKKSNNIKLNTEDIELCIDKALKELENNLLKIRSNKDEARAQILHNYKESISIELVAKTIIDRYSNIRAATCQQAMGLGKDAKNSVYDLVIIDEAARANPLDLFIPMSMARQVILVGDHKQLPHLLEPEVVKKLNRDEKLKELDILGKSLFERLYNIFEGQMRTGGIQRTCQLEIQYRMHPLINDFVSDTFYDGKLKCGLTEQDRTLNLHLFDNKPIVWIEVSKQKYGIETGGRSKEREKEAVLLMENVIKVLRKNDEVKVGVITFYVKQKELLEKLAEVKLTSDDFYRIEIGTVDAFQGKEFDVVFLSCVRANNENENNLKKRIGFLNDNNRLCVSFSRAKSLLVNVGDSETVGVVPSLKKLVELCKGGTGEYINA
ncbi:MAG: AAA family ATPase [Clostridia bacterium]|nr:AAA family ATPase [Clostridia bacterium]